ncbi:cytochrome C oxidase subunit IV family protein [Negadavirga shengliensis]|uniref:Cytochrome C oxidase subunit IV family protein n=1 Tax=Negadavirga shengliensis TaxID=1389218 RepID=A0ABV9SYG7_9BACT
MKNPLLISLLILLGLTMLTAIIANLEAQGTMLAAICIMAIAAAKFLIVAYQFMELKIAHAFWKTTVFFFCILVAGIVGFFSVV